MLSHSSSSFSLSLMQLLRRKSPIISSDTESLIMKNSRKSNNLSIFVIVSTLFIFGVFMYNEDVKSIAEFPFSRSKAQEIQEGKPEKPPAMDNNSQNAKRDVGGDETAAVTVSEKILEKEENSDLENVDLKSVGAKEKKEEEDDKDEEEKEEEEVVELPPEECDLFNGEWVFDNVTHPLYKENECEFLTAQVTCMRNGRRDSLYQNWRWKPRDCSLPK